MRDQAPTHSPPIGNTQMNNTTKWTDPVVYRTPEEFCELIQNTLDEIREENARRDLLTKTRLLEKEVK